MIGLVRAPRVVAAILIAGTLSFSANAAYAAPDEPRTPALRELPAPAGAENLPLVPGILSTPHHPLGRAMGKPGGCDKDVDSTSTISGAEVSGLLDTGICSNADIDVYTDDVTGKTYAVQAGGEEAAWIHSDISDPTDPRMLAKFKWAGRAGKSTYTPDLKIFKQGINYFAVMALERTALVGGCGVIIYDVTDPVNTVRKSQFSGAGWCDTHNVFVETDDNGDGTHIYATADLTADLRVLDIGDVTAPLEVGSYARSDKNPPTDSNIFDDVYVHDVTVKGGTVYASYWLGGLDMVPASALKSGAVVNNVNDPPPAGVVSTGGITFLSGADFLVHHAMPNADGSAVFIEDEITFVSGDEPVQMWSTAGPTRLDGIELGADIPVLPAHNLEVNPDIDAAMNLPQGVGRLYVGWYKGGLQAWNFDALGFTTTAPGSYTADVYHQAQTEDADEVYSGAWGVRVAEINNVFYAVQSDRNLGLIVDCLGDLDGDLGSCPDAPPPPAEIGSIKGTVTVNGSRTEAVVVSVDGTGLSDDTNKGGKYGINDVGTGEQMLTATLSGSSCSNDTATVTVVAGSTVTADFALDCL